VTAPYLWDLVEAPDVPQDEPEAPEAAMPWDTEQPGAEVPSCALEVYRWCTEAWPAGRGALHAATLARELGRRAGEVAMAVGWLRASGLLLEDGQDAEGVDVYRRVAVGRWRALRDDPLPW
jgi:hypothetical protein